VTSTDGVTLGTFSGDGAEDGDVALPAPLVASVVSLCDKMRVGQLESLVATYDQLVLVILNAPPLARSRRRGGKARPSRPVRSLLPTDRPPVAGRHDHRLGAGRRRRSPRS